jgi:hypothetical protein
MVHVHVSPVATSLGLSLNILAYGVGDLLFSPLTEIPIIERNPIYCLTFVVFWALLFGSAVVNTFGGLLALRFWIGFFGRPALANRGATIRDMYSLIYIPFRLSWWVFIYITFSYPKYAAPFFAGNSVWRPGTAGGSVIFARPLFTNLGIYRGMTLLGGLSVAGIFGTIALYSVYVRK